MTVFYEQIIYLLRGLFPGFGVELGVPNVFPLAADRYALFEKKRSTLEARKIPLDSKYV